jgi:hypothetical protein
MTIDRVPIRATIHIGNIKIKTPYILSFNVNKARNTKSTFSASLKVRDSNLSNITNNNIIIKAGTAHSLKTIFTGYVLNSTASPCWDDPNYVVLNVSGSDILYRLENERFTRRQTTTKTTWATITGIQRKGAKSGLFKLVNYNALIPTDGDLSTDDQTKDKQLNINDLQKYGMPVSNTVRPSIPLEISTIIDQPGGGD